MDIWNVSDNIWTKLILWRNADNVFRVVQDGDFNLILTNPNYILIDKLFAPIFIDLFDQIVFKEVKIISPQSDQVSTNYLELEIRSEINPSTIFTVKSEGRKVWHYGEYIFVSGELKEAMNLICPKRLKFTEGFSHFGG